jgi:hypothetical protein
MEAGVDRKEGLRIDWLIEAMRSSTTPWQPSL